MKPTVIHYTSNYDLLGLNPHQRDFNSNHAKDLIRKMTGKGFRGSSPISVSKLKNGKLQINTGHHRLYAARALGIPAAYVIEDEWTLEEMVEEGTSCKNWDMKAVVDSFALGGNKHYLKLVEYSNHGISLSYAAAMLVGQVASSNGSSEAIKNGTYKIKTQVNISILVKIIEEFAERMPAIRSRAFINCYSKCLFTDEFDSEVFERKLRKHRLVIEKTNNSDQMLEQIESIYNYQSSRIHPKIPLVFLVQQEMKARHESYFKTKKK